MEKTDVNTQKKKDWTSLLVCVFCSSMLIVLPILLLCNLYSSITLPSSLDVQIANIVFWIVGIVAILFLKKWIPPYFTLLYTIFLFLSHFLGSVLGFYSLKFLHIGLWWDKFLHTLFGYIICYVALYIVCKMTAIHKLSHAFILLTIFGFSSATAVLWEIVEFVCDCFLRTTAQGDRLPLADGGFVIAVTDTMTDFLVHMGGTLIFMLQYILYATTKKSFYIGYTKKVFNSER